MRFRLSMQIDTYILPVEPIQGYFIRHDCITFRFQDSFIYFVCAVRIDDRLFVAHCLLLIRQLISKYLLNEI